MNNLLKKIFVIIFSISIIFTSTYKVNADSIALSACGPGGDLKQCAKQLLGYMLAFIVTGAYKTGESVKNVADNISNISQDELVSALQSSQWYQSGATQLQLDRATANIFFEAIEGYLNWNANKFVDKGSSVVIGDKGILPLLDNSMLESYVAVYLTNPGLVYSGSIRYLDAPYFWDGKLRSNGIGYVIGDFAVRGKCVHGQAYGVMPQNGGSLGVNVSKYNLDSKQCYYNAKEERVFQDFHSYEIGYHTTTKVLTDGIMNVAAGTSLLAYFADGVFIDYVHGINATYSGGIIKRIYNIENLGWQTDVSAELLMLDSFMRTQEAFFNQFKGSNGAYFDLSAFELLERDYNSFLETIPLILEGLYKPNPFPTPFPTPSFPPFPTPSALPTAMPNPTDLPFNPAIPFPTAPSIGSLPQPTIDVGVSSDSTGAITGNGLGSLLSNALGSFLQGLLSFLGALFSPLISILEWLGNLISVGLSSVLSGLGSLLSSILNALNSILSFLKSLVLDFAIDMSLDTYFNDFLNQMKTRFSLFFDLTDFIKLSYSKLTSFACNTCMYVPGIDFMSYELSKPTEFCFSSLDGALDELHGFYMIVANLVVASSTLFFLYNKVFALIKKGWK